MFKSLLTFNSSNWVLGATQQTQEHCKQSSRSDADPQIPHERVSLLRFIWSDSHFIYLTARAMA